VASLGSLASEVSAIYGLKSGPILSRGEISPEVRDAQVERSLEQFSALRKSALNGVATIAIGMGARRGLTTADWLQLAQTPTLWPVEGHITSGFGDRVDPFNGEGATHRGVDISTGYGERIIAPADGVVGYVGFYSGYGRMIEIDHGHGVITRYGHLSSYVIAEGESVHRGQVIGYVGLSGRSTGPHLHYEVWVRNSPVNPRSFLRTTVFTAAVHSGD
jgi:murein DD-endopeptidase MepM/ murein hydrolase activator NlpD